MMKERMKKILIIFMPIILFILLGNLITSGVTTGGLDVLDAMISILIGFPFMIPLIILMYKNYKLTESIEKEQEETKVSKEAIAVEKQKEE